MRAYLWEKIMNVRQKPEHVRRRYAYACLIVSMLFIFGIWLLTLKEGFGSVSELPETVLKNKQEITQEKTPSLNELFKESKPLQVTGKQSDDKNFFDSQFDGKTGDQAAGEGVANPKQ